MNEFPTPHLDALPEEERAGILIAMAHCIEWTLSHRRAWSRVWYLRYMQHHGYSETMALNLLTGLLTACLERGEMVFTLERPRPR